MVESLKVAVVGAGYFSQFHYEAWQRLENVALVAVCDLDRAKAEAVAAKYAVPNVFQDLAQMLDQVQPDILDVVTPPPTHFEAIKTAGAHGVTTICQKPFCQNLAEAKAAVQFANEAGIDVIVHENFRFQPWYRKIHELLHRERLIGTPYLATFRLRPGDGQGPDAYLDRQPYFQTMERFLVHETAIHQIDTFRYLLGEVTAIYADLRRLNPAIAGEDAGVVLFDFGDDMRAVFDGNRLSDHVAANRRLTMGELNVEGANGVIALNGYGEIWHRTHGDNAWHQIPYAWRDHGYGGDCVFLLQEAAVFAKLGQQPFENLAQDYLRNIEIEEAVYRSDAEGRKVDVR